MIIIGEPSSSGFFIGIVIVDISDPSYIDVSATGAAVASPSIATPVSTPD